jgi:hypothetical protein
MKAQPEATIQFSGYPLSIVEKKPKLVKSELTVIKSVFSLPTTSIQENSITNDPRNWDVDWFNGYE